MTNIAVYDIEANALEKKADELGTTVAEIIEQLCDYLDEVE
jgi:hypothetical protein